MIVLGFLVFKERITANIALWTAVSLTGLFFISNLTAAPSIDAHGAGSPAGNSVDARYFLGVLQALAAASLYAVAALFARLLKGNPPTLIALLQMVLGAVVLWPFADFGGLLSQGFNRQAIATVLLGVFHTGVMYILLYGALQKLEASQAASYFVPVPRARHLHRLDLPRCEVVAASVRGHRIDSAGCGGDQPEMELTAVRSTRRTLANDRNSGS
ncbi:EamA family transporter [Variovorax sp. UC122_21]|uniref:EamA family transporter n=1 Tax=Variovorax sp. UC122_21 TaxID=3374554 RepID=UPI003756459C